MNNELLNFLSILLDRITVIKLYLQMDLENSKVDHKIVTLLEVEKVEKEIKEMVDKIMR